MEPAVKKLESPFDILDLKDGESTTIRVERWERGLMTIHPRYAGAPPEKEIQALRVWLFKEYKPYFPPYKDITAGKLIGQLIPILESPGSENLEIIITKRGFPPKAIFQVSVKP